MKRKKTFLFCRCGDHWFKCATFAHLEPSQHAQHICTSRVCPSKASSYISLPLFYSLPIKPPKTFLCTGLLTHLVYLSHRNQGWVQIIVKKNLHSRFTNFYLNWNLSFANRHNFNGVSLERDPSLLSNGSVSVGCCLPLASACHKSVWELLTFLK